MKKLNQNKVILVLLGILLVCFIVLGIVFYKFFYAGSSSSKYGDRLQDIEKYKLSETLSDDVNSLYSENDNVDNVKIDVKGKIVYIMINYKNNTSTSEAKDLATKALEAIGEDNLSYYDIQFILSVVKDDESEEDNTNFPIFGAKSANSNKIVW